MHLCLFSFLYPFLKAERCKTQEPTNFGPRSHKNLGSSELSTEANICFVLSPEGFLSLGSHIWILSHCSAFSCFMSAWTKLFNSMQCLIFLIWGDWVRFLRCLNFKRFCDFYSAPENKQLSFSQSRKLSVPVLLSFHCLPHWYSFILFFIGLFHLIEAILRWLTFPLFLIQLIFSSTLHDFSTFTLVSFFPISFFKKLNLFNVKFTMFKCTTQWH